MPAQKKLDGEEARITNAYIGRTVSEINRVLAGLEPDIRLIVLARVQRDVAEEIGSIEHAVVLQRQREALGR